MTGNLLPADADFFKAQGANAVLGKPLNVKAFEAVLNQLHWKDREGIGVHQEEEEEKLRNNKKSKNAVSGIEMV